MVDKTLSSIVGGGSIYPTIEPKDLGAAAFSSMQNGNRIQGFAGNGDYITLPTTSTGSFDYFNAAGVSQSGFPIAIADVATAVTGTPTTWVCWGTYGSLLWGVARDGNINPGYSFFTVDSAGTIAEIGTGATPTTDFANVPSWAQASSPGAANMSRVDDTGNIFITATISGAVEEWEVSSSTGAQVTDVTTVSTGLVYAPTKTVNGLYVGPVSKSGSGPFAIVNFASSSGTENIVAVIPFADIPCGGPGQYAGVMQTWGYRTYVTPQTSAGLYGPRFYDKTSFESEMEEFAKVFGVAP